MITLLVVGIVAFALFLLQALAYQKMWNKSLYARIEFASLGMFEGDTGELREVVENRKNLPLPVLRVKFQTDRGLSFGNDDGSRVTDLFYRNDVFHVNGKERITRKLPFTAKKRGYYKILGIDLVAADTFMISEMVDTRQQDDCYLYVYPKPFISPELLQSLKQLNGEIQTKRHLIEDPFEYRGIREYQPFDDMRSVNWKATAKTGELKVNQKSYTCLANVRIFFNIEDNGILKKDDAVEMTLRIVSGIAQYFIAQGIRTSVYGNGVDVITGEAVSVEPGAGSGQFDQINKTLARIDTTKEPHDFVQIFGEKLLTEEKGTRTMIVSPNAYDDFTELLRQYTESGSDYMWFYPVWSSETPAVPDWVADHLTYVPIRRDI